MMTYTSPSQNRPYHAVSTLIERHGLWRVLRAVAAASLRLKGPARIFAPEAMSDHMRRDVGLTPKAPPRQHWPPQF